MHAYHECWYIFMALYFEVRQLPWLKQNGRRPRKTLANSEPFTLEIWKVINHHVSRLPKKQQ